MSSRPKLHRALNRWVLTIVTAMACAASLTADDHLLEEIGCVALPNITNPGQAENLSGAALSADGGLLVLATDEGSELLVIRTDGASLEAPASIELGEKEDPGDPNQKPDELDLEGVTRHGGDSVFVAVGSHSYRRKNIYGEERKEATFDDLRKRFEADSPDREKDRDRLILVKLDSQSGKLISAKDLRLGPQNKTLHKVLKEHPVLGPFRSLPSKENGVDIEGIASDGDDLYIAFRGPVLRFGLVPVLVVAAEGDDKPELRYVQLGGRGIRDIARVSDGFLIVAGPVGDLPPSYQLYHWDGNTVFPGTRGDGDPPLGEMRLLGEIPTPANGKAEGLVVLAEYQPVWVTGHRGGWVLLVLFDGPAGGGPVCLRVDRP